MAFIGCQSHSVQTTSGRQYLNKYEGLDRPSGKSASIDEEVREIANVEPTLRFPARIGLAKLYNGRISNLTAEEVEGWEKAKEEMGAEFGEFIPVSSMIAELAYTAPKRTKDTPSSNLRRFSEKFALGQHGSTSTTFSSTKSFRIPRPPSLPPRSPTGRSSADTSFPHARSRPRVMPTLCSLTSGAVIHTARQQRP